MLVATGGAIGALCRFGITLVANKFFPASNSVTGTVLANSMGCFLSGILLASAANELIGNSAILLFLSTGLMGAFTTFSTFSLELYVRLSGCRKTLMIYILLQLGLAIGLFFLGYAIMNLFYAGGWFV